MLGQFVNPANPEAHYRTTGPEIWRDSNGIVDILVAGIGTGGTLSGAGRYLKEQNADVRVVGVEPAASPLLTEGRAGPHALQGIGANFIPDTLVAAFMMKCSQCRTRRHFPRPRPWPVRGFAGGHFFWRGAMGGCGAGPAAGKTEGKTVVAVLTDTGERYLSTRLFEEG